jgi:hypothetical protein
MHRLILPLLVLWGCTAPAAGEKDEGMTHPGTIVSVDLDAGTEEARPLDGIPEGIAWVEVEGQRVPVVRIESRLRGESREIKRYGPGGRLLEVLVSAPPPGG